MNVLRAACCSLILIASSCCLYAADKEAIYQVSTIGALLEGAYDGSVTLKQLKGKGDFGIGTLEALDGELIMLDGKAYQVKGDGTVDQPGGGVKVPFAVVTYFDEDRKQNIPEGLMLGRMLKLIDRNMPSRNMPCAVRIEGTFTYMRTRSVPRQTKPYAKLTEVTRKQPVFEFRGVKGTLVGFRLPQYLEGINVPGYHLHFISEDGKRGGHVLEARTGVGCTVILDDTPQLQLQLPDDEEFAGLKLTGNHAADVEKAEK